MLFVFVFHYAHATSLVFGGNDKIAEGKIERREITYAHYQNIKIVFVNRMNIKTYRHIYNN